MSWRVAGPLSALAFGLGLLVAIISFGDRGNEAQSGLLPAGSEPEETSAPSPSPLPPEIKIIALDAGHGGEDTGATYPVDAGVEEALLFEKDLNLAVVFELKSLLEDDGGFEVILTRETDEFILAREREALAVEECERRYGRPCELYISVHHNGFEDSLVDGPLLIHNEEEDLALASALLESLQSGLAFPPEVCSYGYFFTDYGLTQEDFGLPFYEGLPSVTTEAYYLTNDCEASHHLSGGETFTVCDEGGTCREVTLGTRVQDEAKALYEGIQIYLSSVGDGEY